MKWKNDMAEKNWIAVASDFSTRRYMVPFFDPGLHLWIHLDHERDYDANTPLFNYELYSPELIKLEMRTGNFKCLRIFDHCRQAGCGTHCSVWIEIADGAGTARCFHGFSAGDAGAVGAIRFMRQLHRMGNWGDFDDAVGLADSLGVSLNRLDDMIIKELAGTGITLT